MPAGREDARRLAHEIFDPIAEECLRRDGVDIGPMFGSDGLRVRAKVFAFVGSAGVLVLKLPTARTAELVESGTAERMVTRDRPMREWVTVDRAHAADWPPLTAEAFAFVDRITP